jgi:exopolyphosphatase/pppGpp-phosphohydrolase
MRESPFQDQLTAQYNSVRALVPDTPQLALLHIGAEHTGVVVRCESGPPAVLTLMIGSQKTAREHFRHTPPSPFELENAITVVEDEVTRARPLMTRDTRLTTADPAIRHIAVLAGVPESPHMVLSLEVMERTFDRLARVAQGRPASFEGLPESPDFAATLLILREFMHHLQFAEISIYPSAPE